MVHSRGPIAETNYANADINLGKSELLKSYRNCQSGKHASDSMMNFAMLLQYIDIPFALPLLPHLLISILPEEGVYSYNANFLDKPKHGYFTIM